MSDWTRQIPDMGDLVQRLRFFTPDRWPIAYEAADRIEKLEAALREIADTIVSGPEGANDMRIVALRALEVK